MSELIAGLKEFARLFSRYRTLALPDEAYFVGSEFERDLSSFASRLSQYERSGASRAMCESLLQGTGLRLAHVSGASPTSVSLPLIGAVVSGNLSISYFIPQRRPASPQKPVLAKSIFEGSSFYISGDTDGDVAASVNTRLLIRDDDYSTAAVRIRIQSKAYVPPRAPFSSLSNAELLDQPHAVEILKQSVLKTNGDVLAHLLCTHPMFHIAQLSACRRKSGRRAASFVQRNWLSSPSAP